MVTIGIKPIEWSRSKIGHLVNETSQTIIGRYSIWDGQTLYYPNGTYERCLDNKEAKMKAFTHYRHVIEGVLIRHQRG